jgi:hypothetical protein
VHVALDARSAVVIGAPAGVPAISLPVQVLRLFPAGILL